MPYTVRKQKCKRSDGKSGNYVLKYKPKKPTKKKKDSEGFVKAGCHPSKKSANAQRAAIEGGPRESLEINSNILDETALREMIREQILSAHKAALKMKTLKEEQAPDQDFNPDELAGLNLPTNLKKLLDPDITPAKYADIDQMIDQSGNVEHQAFAIAAFILSYADMDDAAADAILTKTRGYIPKIMKARERKKEKTQS